MYIEASKNSFCISYMVWLYSTFNMNPGLWSACKSVAWLLPSGNITEKSLVLAARVVVIFWHMGNTRVTCMAQGYDISPMLAIEGLSIRDMVVYQHDSVTHPWVAMAGEERTKTP